jgi:hypothetical protein
MSGEGLLAPQAFDLPEERQPARRVGVGEAGHRQGLNNRAAILRSENLIEPAVAAAIPVVGSRLRPNPTPVPPALPATSSSEDDPRSLRFSNGF